MSATLDCSSLSDISQTDNGADINTAFDHIYTGLKSCLNEYKKKEKQNANVIEKLGCTVHDLPANSRKQLKNIFSDNEVFNFGGVESKEMLMVNPLHMVESLNADSELAEVRRLKIQLDSLLNQLQKMSSNLQRTLEIEKNQLQDFEEKANEIAVQEMVFRGKLEKVLQEKKTLEQISEMMERPKFTLAEIQCVHDDMTTVKTDIELTKTKLAKYNNLGLTQKEATKQLAQLKEELRNVNNEINQKVYI